MAEGEVVPMPRFVPVKTRLFESVTAVPPLLVKRRRLAVYEPGVSVRPRKAIPKVAVATVRTPLVATRPVPVRLVRDEPPKLSRLVARFVVVALVIVAVVPKKFDRVWVPVKVGFAERTRLPVRLSQ